MAKEHLYDHETGAAYGTHKSYIQGFILSVVITTIAFVLVGFKLLSPVALCVSVALLALIQLFVQLVFFLHLSTDSKARWNLISAIFALIVVFIVVAGTIWIMFDLYDMMM
ncbi:cytochrome o ubiquinol oxidase subunit IV [Allofrancisella frigidaquae]|uniref:Cytochrome bo(3) ubiquinol oxidase subunit 4 n=1 Tax=Allofrancisella frigidaquae TaxID=1085644 RepID=A0A6M3HVG9_9GAMM|nr:cytochrome o ubiquinol oxidase subunit IV [Allofrancisella frigidaquae]KEI35125.1 cytochrome O ubiquinol oxidase, subunit IV [Francisella sp. W12-1067]QIV95207.1 cytochrome o ubiquinol oxidase subunit IV [Allofrancisella frigidaquae]